MLGDSKGLVLVVEDERAIADLVRLYLAREGFGVHVEADGAAGLAAARRLHPVAIVLDVGLPGLDGTELCRRLRADGDWTPVLFVTARDDEVDRVLGLELGADDYVTKPFSPRELVARVKTVLRRTRGVERSTPLLQVGRVSLDPDRRRAYVDSTEVALTDHRVRPARLPAAPARPGVRAGAPAVRGLGVRGRGRHPHGRRARRPAAGQARRRQPDPYRPRRRLLGGVPVDPAGPLFATAASRWRPARIALVTTAVAVVAVLVAGLVSLSLVNRAGDADARRTLSALADAAAEGAGGSGRLGEGPVARPAAHPQPAQRAQDRLHLPHPDRRDQRRPGRRAGQPGADRGRAAGGGRRPVDVADPGRRRRADPGRGAAGHRRRRRAGPVGLGRLVRRDAVKRIALSLLIGLAVAALAGVLLARLLARPLRRAAQTAHLLAAGARDVRVPPEGPAEVAEVADSLNALSAALATSEGRQREFLLSVSHELRTPLTAITGFAESLADGVTTGPDVQPVARTVLGEAHRLERLVSDLLDLARLGAQDFRIDLRPVDLTALMETAGEVWRARCEAVGVVGLTDLPRHPLLCLTDPTRVRQIVDGLAENALRVTPAGRPVLLGLYETPGARAVLQVRDGGPGLSPEDLPVAFERSVLYERYRGVRQVGTGVGLALVHGLTTRLGGSADAGRAPEGGACFTVRLPLQPTPTAITVPLPQPGPPGGGSVPAPGGR